MLPDPGQSSLLPPTAFVRRALELLFSGHLELGPGWERRPDDVRLAILAEHIGAVFDADVGGFVAKPEFTIDAFDTNDSLLVQADKLVNGPRRGDYGHPGPQFELTAALLNAATFKQPFTALDVVEISELMKFGRQRMRYKKDNQRDLAGYAQVYEFVRNWEQRKKEPEPK